MRVLFVHKYLGAFGGAEANIHLTATELQRRGHTVGLFYGTGTGRSEEAWRQTFAQCFRFGETLSAETFREVFEIFQPELIYVHNLPSLEAMEALLKSSAPLVRMVHDHDLYCMRSYKYNYFTREICRRPTSSYCVFPCLAFIGRKHNGRLPVKFSSLRAKRKELRLNRYCRRLVVYSEYAKAELLRNGFDPKRIQVHVPIRCWGTRAPVSSFSQRNLVLYVGQIVRGKGVDVLLEALAKVKVRFECLILGEGSHRAHCERLCRRLGLGRRVQFRGFVLRDQLKHFYLESSVFMVSSLWPEPFGLVGPEAMRYGLPVVGFDAGGIREWLIDGQNGYLVPWKNTEIYAARVEQLLRNKNLARELGRRGLERVNEQYNAARQVDGLENMFNQVLQEQSRTPSWNGESGTAFCE